MTMMGEEFPDTLGSVSTILQVLKSIGFVIYRQPGENLFAHCSWDVHG
jgi:hypothetical protein